MKYGKKGDLVDPCYPSKKNATRVGPPSGTTQNPKYKGSGHRTVIRTRGGKK